MKIESLIFEFRGTGPRGISGRSSCYAQSHAGISGTIRGHGRDRWWRREIDEWTESRKRWDAVPGRSRLAEKVAVGR
jgi:hypothetical protein